MANSKKKKPKVAQLSPIKYIQEKGRKLPVYECFINNNWELYGVTYVIITRQHKSGNYTLGYYLVDTFCRGVKDTTFRFNIDEFEYEEFKQIIFDNSDPLLVSYEEAHNIIFGAISYAEDCGFKPCPQFNLTQYLLEEDTEEIPLIEYEFGKDGQPCLVVDSQLEASYYLPTLKNNVGENYDCIILDEEIEEENIDDLENISDILDDMSEEELNQLSIRLKQFQADQKKYLSSPKTIYAYQHPEYPAELKLNYPEELQDLFKGKYNYNLPEDCIERISSIPQKNLAADLKHIIRYEIGRTYLLAEKDDWDEDDVIATLSHVLLFIAGLRLEECLEEILEILRQSSDFMDYHFGYIAKNLLIPALYEAGHNQLQRLSDFMKEPGLDSFNKSCVYYMIQNIAHNEPERREEIIDWFRTELNYRIANNKDLSTFDSDLGAGLCNALIDLKAEELLPEIKQLYEVCDINILVNGDYEETKKYILSDDELSSSYTIDRKNIYDTYKNYKSYFN